MIITNEIIETLNPCASRHENYMKFYKGKSHTRKQFMGLKNITHEDKLWVAFRLMHKEKLRLANAANAAYYAAYVAYYAADASQKKVFKKKIRTIVLKYWK